jgi:hypothetical protein
MKGVLMKKIVVLLLVLAIVAGQALFAQEEGLKVSGHVKTGLRIQGNNVKDLTDGTDAQALVNKDAYGDEPDYSDGYVDAYNDDAGSATQGRLQLTYTQGNVGAKVQFNANLFGNQPIIGVDETKIASGSFEDAFVLGGYSASLGHAYGWYDLLNGMIRTSAGILDNGVWGTRTGFHHDTHLDNYNLFKLEVKPIAGLSLGVNTFDVVADGPREFNRLFSKTVYGAAYDNADVGFGISAEFVGWSTGYSAKWGKNKGSAALNDTTLGTLFSAYFKGVENLVLEMDGTFATVKYTGENDKDLVFNSFGISAQGTYTIDKLNVGVQLDLGTSDEAYNGEKVYGDLGFVVTPKVSYIIITDLLTASLDIPIGFVENYSDKDGAVENWKGGFDFGIKPKFAFNLGNGATFNAWYVLDTHKPGYMDEDGAKAPDALVKHTVQFDLIWSF